MRSSFFRESLATIFVSIFVSMTWQHRSSVVLSLMLVAPFLLSCGEGVDEPPSVAKQELVQAEEEVARVRAQLEVNPRSPRNMERFSRWWPVL